MRIVMNIISVLLIMFGGIWFLQGVDVLQGSRMSGQTQWAVTGPIVLVVGVALLWWTNRAKSQSKAT